MNDVLPLVSGLIGALIGAGASITAQIIQARVQSKRDRIKLIIETAIHDQQHLMNIAVKSGRPTNLMPLPVYVHYHAGMLDLLERDLMTPETLSVLKEQNREIMAMIETTPPRPKS
ncbi:MAG TPA: hypothetical protein VJV04_09645 [Nitrospiraceae bacterium]|nr:hypothetical protein [Nitrospiraceae bacterium]